jgi:transposase
LEDSIEQDNSVRAIEQFVNQLDLADLGFRQDHTENGPPAYHPSVLLKLYIYGYLNRTRSSRQLEKECHRNIELMWLLESLAPDHNTISNFRKDNAKAIKKVFFATVSIARNFGLIGATLIAGDSTKFRAQNSKKNNCMSVNCPKVKYISYI